MEFIHQRFRPVLTEIARKSEVHDDGKDENAEPDVSDASECLVHPTFEGKKTSPLVPNSSAGAEHSKIVWSLEQLTSPQVTTTRQEGRLLQQIRPSQGEEEDENPIHRVFGVNELLVNILQRLSYYHLLLLQIIARRWRDIITGTPILQRILMKKPTRQICVDLSEQVNLTPGVATARRPVIFESACCERAKISPERVGIIHVSLIKDTVFHPFLRKLWDLGLSSYLEIGTCPGAPPGQKPSRDGRCISTRVTFRQLGSFYTQLTTPRVVPDFIRDDFAFQPAFRYLSLIWRIGDIKDVGYRGRPGLVETDLMPMCARDTYPGVKRDDGSDKGMRLEEFVEALKASFHQAVGRSKVVYTHDVVMACAGVLEIHFHR